MYTDRERSAVGLGCHARPFLQTAARAPPNRNKASCVIGDPAMLQDIESRRRTEPGGSSSLGLHAADGRVPVAYRNRSNRGASRKIVSTAERSRPRDVFQEQVISGARTDAVRNEAYLETRAFLRPALSIPSRSGPTTKNAKMESHLAHSLLHGTY